MILFKQNFLRPNDRPSLAKIHKSLHSQTFAHELINPVKQTGHRSLVAKGHKMIKDNFATMKSMVGRHINHTGNQYASLLLSVFPESQQTSQMPMENTSQSSLR